MLQVAHVAMGILVGSLVTRVLLVHALNLALLLLASTSALVLECSSALVLQCSSALVL